MSVIRSARSTSGVQFLYTARLLQIYTIQKCVGFPKRYTFYISQPLAAIATRIYEDAKRGNSVYPTNQHEAQLRRDYFLQAVAELQNLVSQVEVAYELFHFDANIMTHWMELVDTEMKLIKAVLKSDKSRYKDLP
jgi:hypothetical protein